MRKTEMQKGDRERKKEKEKQREGDMERIGVGGQI